MKEELYKYLSIGLLALLLLVCFGSLVTYFVVGQESINVAYAAPLNNGYVQDNYFPNNYAANWDYNITLSNTDTLLESNEHVAIYIRGSGTIVDNYFSGSWLGLKVVFLDSYYNYSTNNFCYAVGYHGLASNMSVSYNASLGGISRSGTDSYQSSQSYFFRSLNISPSIVNDYVEWIYGPGIYFDWFHLGNGTTFSGYVAPSYVNYGYNQGYTDGVNSAGGGGISSLDNLSWVMPSSLPVYSGSVTYDVSGVLNYGGTSFSSLVYFGSSLLLIPSNYQVQEGDILTFTGGTDIDNSDLIDLLTNNGSFIGYSDGYQDGYNSGYDIGYHDGYEQGNLDTIVTLDTTLQPFGSSTFTGVINQDPTTFWWSVQPGMQPNTAVYGYLCFNISSLPIGSIVHLNFPFQKFTLKDTSNVSHEFTDVRVLYDVN